MAHGGGGEGETLDDDEEDEKEDELGRSDGCRRNRYEQLPAPLAETEEDAILACTGETQEAADEVSAKNQYLSALVVSGMCCLSIGTVLGFSAILLPQLEEEGKFAAKSEEASWIASLSNIGQLLGSLCSGFVASYYGRKRAIFLLCVPLLAGWITVLLSGGEFAALCIGRVLQGAGIMSSVTQVYLVEIADGKRRGWFGASGALTVSAGITLVYSLGAALHWSSVCLFCGAVPVAIAGCMTLLPETPNWLANNGRREEALQALQWLRGPKCDVRPELASILSSSKTDSTPRQDEDEDEGEGEERRRRQFPLSDFSQPECYRPLLILVGTFFLQQASGHFAVIFYAVNIFKDIGVTSNPYVPAIIVGVIRLAGSLIGTILIRHFGRRPLMVVSSIGMGVSMSCLALNLFLLEMEREQDGAEDRSRSAVLRGAPLVEIVAYMLSNGIGVGTVPWLLLGELCPARVKGVASGITVFVAFSTIFCLVKVFPAMLSTMGAPATYGTFAGVCFLTTAFAKVVIPETRGRTLQEVEDLFKKDKSKRDPSLPVKTT